MKKKFMFGILAVLLALGLTLAGCDNGTTNNDPPTWWEGQYPIEEINGVPVSGAWIRISTTGLTTSLGYSLSAIVSAQAGGNVLKDSTVIGEWVYIYGNGSKRGIAVNITNYTHTGQVLALGNDALATLATDIISAGITLSGNPVGPFFDPTYQGSPFYIYSIRGSIR
jgi:uncharacterized lipoprotein NlpE involved in copper resistance